ncbi:MAG TPA: 1-deoxy-D-xylulose-5-phosphate synthase [bacterium]|nr:1-deoxy-D-xylulose-5-phosphate synthase [bacterium]
MSILERINGPSDIKCLSIPELYRLAAEIRGLIISTVTVNGGHLASNLGVVELTLALHRVFTTPADSIVWDVGHQCYTHKILTGRRDDFSRVRRSDGISGFPKHSESVHDAFEAGHASTSISAALGILAANEALERRDAVIAVIGDGALTGGMAYEAMSHAGQLGLPLIIVLNDNAMSISRNVGAVSSYLSRLSTTTRYQRIRSLLDRIILGVPFLGPRMHPLVLRLKRAVKAIFFKESLFADLGFEYAGPIDGHNIELLSDVLGQARAIRKPVVVHVVTRKGKGHDAAEQNPAAFHGLSPATQPQSALLSSDPLDPAAAPAPKRITFTEAFGAAMLEAAATDRRIVAVTAAMSSGTGLSEFQRRYPRRLFDVGIAEEHAVTFAAGLAAGGLRPVVAIYSTFMQRAVDQVHHDVALGDRSVIFAVDRAGAVPDDGETHQGLYDIQAYRSVPGLTILAPASAAEVAASLRWAIEHQGPTMIRYPKSVCPPERPAYAEPLESGAGVFVRRSESGAPVLFVSSGALVDEALRASALCASAGIGADVYHLRFIKPLDQDAFVERVCSYRLVVIAEEGVLTGSVAADLAAAVSLASSGSASQTCAFAVGFDERPLSQGSRAELLARAGLDGASLARLALARMAGIDRAASAASARDVRNTGSGA